jgi:hypothetical protein
LKRRRRTRLRSASRSVSGFRSTSSATVLFT